MDNIQFGAKLIDLVKEYLGIEDKEGYVCISQLDIKMGSGATIPTIKLECCQLPK